MSILKLDNLYYSVSTFPLLDNTSYVVRANTRLALIGRNGEGKSTLLKMVAGVIEPESGQIVKDKGTKVALLSQDLPQDLNLTVYEYVATGLQELSKSLIRYHSLTQQADSQDQDAWLHELNQVQQTIETLGGWDTQQRIDKALAELQLPADTKLADLSGGWRRKAALAQCLVQQPDILLLDEPTNHLDLSAIEWLEARIKNYPNTVIFITHDRQLLQAVATDILELDRGRLREYPADYELYSQRKAKELEDELQANALFDKRLAEEEKWIRQGIKARRTRNEGRVRALKALREERTQRRERKDKPEFQAHETDKRGKTVLQAQSLCFGYTPDTPIIEDFTFNIIRGDKVAIVGANGAGKTTLIKLLLGQLEPTAGTLKHSPTNQWAFFEQTRATLEPDKSLIDNVAQGDDFVEIGGQRKHIIGYLGEFLFPPKKCHSLVKTLSGGEQNRLLLAKLFSKPANVFVLDEPTNDLDMETLELLESLLQNLKSTVLLISHDRQFIDNIATYTIALEQDKPISIHVGGYSDYQDYLKQTLKPKQEKETSAPKVETKKSQQKLNYREQQELKNLPGQVEKLEGQVASIESQMMAEGFYQQSEELVKTKVHELEQIKLELEKAYERWESLESKDG